MEDRGLLQDHEVISQDEACVRLVQEEPGGSFPDLFPFPSDNEDTGTRNRKRVYDKTPYPVLEERNSLGEMAPGVYVTLYYDQVLMNLNRRMNLGANQKLYTQKDLQKLFARTRKDT